MVIKEMMYRKKDELLGNYTETYDKFVSRVIDVGNCKAVTTSIEYIDLETAAIYFEDKDKKTVAEVIKEMTTEQMAAYLIMLGLDSKDGVKLNLSLLTKYLSKPLSCDEYENILCDVKEYVASNKNKKRN